MMNVLSGVTSCAKCHGPRECGLANVVMKQRTSSNARFVNHIARIPAAYVKNNNSIR